MLFSKYVYLYSETFQKIDNTKITTFRTMRKSLKLMLCAILVLASAMPATARHKNFKVSVYVRAFEVEKMKDARWLDSTWTIISSQLDVDKIYLETHRDMHLVDDRTLEQAKAYFQKKGIEVAGGITYTISEPNDFETFSYSNPEDRAWVQKVAEHTARHFDEFLLDEGYAAMARLLGGRCRDEDVPPFVRPSYEGIDWGEYFDVVETDNFVTSLWSSGKWVKLVMARGCYWHRCAFCDVKLPYIGCFRMPKAAEIADCLEEFFPSHVISGVHFVDEAMPPALVSALCDEILRRGIDVEWWGNVRFDAAFTPALAKKMAKAGCIAVTGGLECANDRLLALMKKGITLASAEKVLRAFKAAKIFVHAYLMYDFPTETKAEQRGAERYVKSLARKGLIQSCYWHRFALAVHSPIAREPEKFGIIIKPLESNFARNELEYVRKNRPRIAQA